MAREEKDPQRFGESPSENSVTTWLAHLKRGDPVAGQKIWQRYIERLLRLAKGKLGAVSRRVVDEEDIALAAFYSFLMGVDRGRFPRLDDRDDLWQVLGMLAERKAIDQIRRERAAIHGAGQVHDESVFHQSGNGISSQPGLDQFPDPQPTPAFANQVQEELALQLRQLGDEVLRKVAIGKLEGFTNDELAKTLEISVHAVGRKLARIRHIWEKGGNE